MRVLLDACVLYPTVMREVLCGAAAAGLYTPLWSPRILEEWARAAGKPGRAGEALARGEIARLRRDFPAAEIQIPNGFATRFWLPDANDIHVLAAAVRGSADVIVTMNAKDFPQQILAEETLSRADPDGFLLGLFKAHPEVMRRAVLGVHAEAERLSGSPWDLRKLMKKARLPRLGKAVSNLKY